MKHQRLKDMVMGAVVATLIVGVMPTAFAKVSSMNIPVSYNNIKVVVDGKELKTDKEPFTYEGTTYLPVRAVAEAVGKEVKWDSATKTVTLGASAVKTEQTSGEQKSTLVPKTIVLEKGSYIVGKDIAAGTYNCEGTAGMTNFWGLVKSLGATGLNVIMDEDENMQFPAMDTYHIYSNLVLQDGDEIEVDDESAKVTLTPVK